MLDFAQPGSNPGRSGGCQIALTTRLQQNCCLGERGLLVKFRPANPSRSGGCQDSRATRLQRNCWFDRRRSLMASVCIRGWQHTGGAFGTVAILAQGTHWAVAVMQAFLFEPSGLTSTLGYPQMSKQSQSDLTTTTRILTRPCAQMADR